MVYCDRVDELPHALVRRSNWQMVVKGSDWVEWRGESICVLL